MTPEAEAVKRRAEREQAARQQHAVATTESWTTWIDNRIRERLAERDEIWTDSVGEVYAIERADRRRADEELTRKLEELQRADIVRDAIAQERRDRDAAIAAAVAETQRTVETETKAKLEELEHRLKAVPGKLPVAKVWQPETVVYQAEFVSYGGALYQARKDTAQAPGSSAARTRRRLPAAAIGSVSPTPAATAPTAATR